MPAPGEGGEVGSQHALRQTPSVDRQTGVKHNLRNFVYWTDRVLVPDAPFRFDTLVCHFSRVP